MILKVLRFFEFGFARKFGMFLVYWLLLLFLGLSTFNPTYFLYFVIFYLIYSTVYVTNDIIDYDFDKGRNFSHESKILASGSINLKEYALVGFIAFSIGILLSSIFLPKSFIAISTLLILFGICRSYIPNLYLRSFTLFVMEYMNFLAFHLMLSKEITTFFENVKIQVFVIGVSLYYTFLYYFYRKLEKSGNPKKEAKIIAAGTTIALIAFLFLPLYPPSFRAIVGLGLALYGYGWAMSVKKRTTRFVNICAYAFFALVILYSLWKF